MNRPQILVVEDDPAVRKDVYKRQIVPFVGIKLIDLIIAPFLHALGI